MESSEPIKSSSSQGKSSNIKTHPSTPLPFKSSQEPTENLPHAIHSESRQTSTIPIEHEQKQSTETNDSNSNNNKKSSRKKLVRVASQQKEVSGEEYLQLLLEEREVEMKKSMGKYREGTEAQPETSSHKSVELIEDQSSFRKTKSSSKKFLESDDEGESKQGPLDQQKHVSEETQRQDSFGGEERNNSQEKKSMGKNEEMTNSQRNKSQNKDEVVSGTKTSEIKKNEEENRRKSDEMRLEEEKKEDDSIEQIIRTEEKDSKEQKTNINDENYLDTSKFGLSKKKSKEKEELHSVEKEKELERKALEMQGLEKPSLTNFIEQATRDYEINQGIGLETSNVKKSTLLDFLEKSAHDQEKSNAENNEETKTSEIKMKLEPQANEEEPQANEEVPQANEEVPQANEEVKEINEIENPPISHQLEDDKGKEDTSKKSKSSGKSSKSKSKNQSKSKKSPEKKENGDIEIIITLASGDEENKETLETNPVQNPSEELKPKSPQRRRKSSLKPSSYNKDQDVKPVGENKSTKKSAVKFAEMLEISENKNPIIIEDSPKNERITRSKEREMIANEKIEKEEKEEKEEKHQSKRNRKKKTSLKHKKEESEEKAAPVKKSETRARSHNQNKEKKVVGRPSEIGSKEKSKRDEEISKTEINRNKTIKNERNSKSHQASKKHVKIDNDRGNLPARITRGKEKQESIVNSLRSRGKDRSKEEMAVSKKIKK